MSQMIFDGERECPRCGCGSRDLKPEALPIVVNRFGRTVELWCTICGAYWRGRQMCEHVNLPGGGSAIVCRAKPRLRACVGCKRQTRDYKLCDFPVRPGKTCDAVMCQSCATHKEPDTDYCPNHAAMLTPEGRLKL